MQEADEVFGSSAAGMAVLALSTQINGIVLLLCLEMGCELPSEHSSVKFGHGDRRVQPLQQDQQAPCPVTAVDFFRDVL